MPTNTSGGGRVAMLAHTCYMRDPRVRRQAEALAETGVEIHVIALTERDNTGKYAPRRVVVNGVEVHRIPVVRKRGSLLRYFWEYFATAALGGLTLALLQLRGRLDVVHVHNMPDLLVFSAIIPWLCGSKIILDVHDPMPELFKSWDHGASNRLLVAFLGLQERVSCAFADRVISVNDTMRDNLRAKGLPDEKIFIVNNFPDQKLFPVCDASASWPRTKDCLTLLYCGTVTEHYDLALAVRAIARLAGEIPVRLRIVGEGNRLDEALNLASALGVRGSIDHVGLVPIDKVRDEMRNADMGISCHRAGVFGDLYFSTKIVEYLTQGLPVLSPRTRTICRYLPDGAMFYFDAGSEAALAESIRFAWRNPAEVAARLAVARELLPRLSWQAEKGRFVSFYTDLMSNEGSESARASARTR
jgi:glycosyltransferase involved in cell wall biosynthesis